MFPSSEGDAMSKRWVFACLAVLCAAAALAAWTLRLQPAAVSNQPLTPRGNAPLERKLARDIELKKIELQAVKDEAAKREVQRQLDELEKARRLVQAYTDDDKDAPKGTTTSEMMSILANAFSVVTGGLSLLFTWLAYKVQARPGRPLQAPNPEA
jgi:uncharacterized protein YgbK (DUF1537 family)